MKNQPYHSLIVWKEAHKFVLQIYKNTKHFPSDEKFGITSQLKRAAASIPTNIVEGYARRTPKDSLHFMRISQASSKECAYLLELSKDLNYLTEEKFNLLENSRSKADYLLNQFSNSIVKRVSQ